MLRTKKIKTVHETLRRQNRSGSYFCPEDEVCAQEEVPMSRVRSWWCLSLRSFVLLTVALLAGRVGTTQADETCQSPYLPKITGQEDYVYVWTLGAEGLGDGSDKLVTVGANPRRPTRKARSGRAEPGAAGTRRPTAASPTT